MPWKICHMFDRSHYRVDIKRKIVKNPFIHHSFEAMNDFSLKNAVFWIFNDWYFPHSATYQTYSKFSREYNGDIRFLLWAMHLKKIAKNLIIEQHLYEYKKAPLERFTFLQISSELIFVHHWMVELGSVIKVKPGVTRGPLWLGAKFLRDRVVLLFFPAHVQNDMRWFWAVFAHRLTCSCFWMTARCAHVWCQPA